MYVHLLRVLLLLFFFCGGAYAAETDAYAYLNKVRVQAGMLPFSYHEQLALAALNHASYLHMHRLGGHGEQSGRRGFTGSNHIERIIRAGYPSRLTSENVSYHTGSVGFRESIDGLMSAIYRRFAFLNFKHDKVGIGSVQTPEFSTHVYNFGNQRKRELCLLPGYSGRGHYIYQVCPDERFRIAPYEIEKATQDVAAKSVDVVVWPANQGMDIPPAFYEEDPDPLPSYDVSGYPVSIQFNPSVFPGSVPVVSRFQLFRVKDNQLLEAAAKLDAANDANRKFTEYEHALFPAQRLEWGTRYRAEADYHYAGQQESLSWEFTTQELDLPLVTVTSDNQPILVTPGESFAIYVPPRGPRDGEGVYQSRFPSGMKLDIRIHDSHTLIVTASGRRGNASIKFHGLNIRLLQ